MAGLIYYLPGKRTANAEDARAAGLGYALDGAGGPAFAATEKGPDGRGGVVFTLPDARGECPALAPLAASAVWSRIPGEAGAWVGFDPKEPPGPAELGRRAQISGHEVALGDGRAWLVPVARYFDGGTAFPRRLVWDGQDWGPGQVLPKYQELFGAACRIWDQLTGATEACVTLSEESTVCAWALSVNYRIGPAEISALGLFDSQAESAVAKALVDWPALMEYGRKKKLEAETPSARPGAEA